MCASLAARAGRRASRRGPRATAVPGVPGVDLDPAAYPAPVALGVRLAGVVARDPVDDREVGIVLERHAAVQRDVAVPLVAVEHGERDVRLAAQVLEAPAPLVHVDEDPAVLPQ